MKWWSDRIRRSFLAAIRWNGEVYCRTCGLTLEPKASKGKGEPLFDPFLGVKSSSPELWFMACPRASDKSIREYIDGGFERKWRHEREPESFMHFYYWNPSGGQQ